MFERLKRGWQLTKASFRVLERDKEILILPVLAFLSIVLGLAFWGAVGLATIGLPGGQMTIPHYVLLFLMYLTSAFGGTFFLAATIEMATIRLEGGDPVVRDGLAKAWEKKGKLLGWAAVAATVGMLLRLLRQRARGLARLLTAALELGWAVATFFAVPVLVYRDIGPIEAIKHSGQMMRNTWGEAAGGVGSAGIVFFALGLLGLLPIFLGFLAQSGTLILVGIAIAVVYWIVLAAANSAVDGILKAALFRFADTGELPEGFEAADPGHVAAGAEPQGPSSA
jgi:hypothetical protein